MKTRTLLALATAGGMVAGARAKVDRTLDEWSANHDPTGGDPMTVPDGAPVQVASSDGAVLRGVDSGEGPTVLLLHGWTGTAGHWAPVARNLVADGYRVLSVEQRGHGQSSVGDLGFTPEALGADVAAWVEQLELDDAVLAGHSMGGLALQAFGIHHPETAAQVKALVMCSTLPGVIDAGRDRDVMLLAVDRGLDRKVIGRPKLGVLGMRGCLGARPAIAHAEAARATYLHTPAASVAAASRMMIAADLRPLVSTIGVPSHFIVGTHDELTPQAWNEELAGLIPGASIQIVDGAGHMLPWEAPDRVTDCIVQAHKPT